MAVLEPEDDPLAALDFDIEEPTDVTDLTTLSDVMLAELDAQTTIELEKMGEMFAPPDKRSERGKELHSIYTALQVEKHRRNW